VSEVAAFAVCASVTSAYAEVASATSASPPALGRSEATTPQVGAAESAAASLNMAASGASGIASATSDAHQIAVPSCGFAAKGSSVASKMDPCAWTNNRCYAWTLVYFQHWTRKTSVLTLVYNFAHLFEIATQLAQLMLHPVSWLSVAGRYHRHAETHNVHWLASVPCNL
jgi:hypothetical protein